MLKFRRLHLDHSFTITVSRAPVVITLILEYLSFLFSSLSSCFFFSPRFFPRPHSFLVLFVVLQENLIRRQDFSSEITGREDGLGNCMDRGEIVYNRKQLSSRLPTRNLG